MYHQWIAVANDSKQTELPTADEVADERSEGDRIVDGMDFGELCDEFECISSPLVEATARQLVRDILQLRQANRALGCFATAVKYKVVFKIDRSQMQLSKLFHHCSISLLKVKKQMQDPVRSFVGRDKYKRPLWATQALDNPKVVSKK